MAHALRSYELICDILARLNTKSHWEVVCKSKFCQFNCFFLEWGYIFLGILGEEILEKILCN